MGSKRGHHKKHKHKGENDGFYTHRMPPIPHIGQLFVEGEIKNSRRLRKSIRNE